MMHWREVSRVHLWLSYFITLFHVPDFWKFANSDKIIWNFAQMTEWALCIWKNLVWITKHTSKCFGKLFKNPPIYLSRPFSVVYLFIWQLTILHRSHMKFLKHCWITGFWWENKVWSAYDSLESVIVSLIELTYLTYYATVCVPEQLRWISGLGKYHTICEGFRYE